MSSCRSLWSVYFVRRLSLIVVVTIAMVLPDHDRLSLLSLCNVARADQAADDYAAAVGFYKQSRWGFAEAAFKKFVKEFPKHDRVAFAKLYLGLTLTNLEKYDEARTVLRGFVKEYPNNQQVPQAMYRVAEASYFLEDLKAAESEFVAFLAKSPEDPLREYALPYLGDAQMRLEKPEAAAANFQNALKAFPQSKMSDDSRFGLAKAFEASQKFREAIELYQQVASNKTGLRAAEAQARVAARQFELKEFANAAKSYAILEQNFPQSKYVPVARLNAGYALYELKDFKAAATQFELAGKEPEQAAVAGYWRGMSQKQQGDLAGAAAILKSTVEAHAQHAIADQMIFQWADCELRLAQFESAELHFADVAKRWPQSPWADDSLYFAGEAALQRANQSTVAEVRNAALQAADGYVKQFATTQPNSGLKLFVDLLRGRLLLSRGTPADVTASVELFKGVLAAAQRPQTQMQARFQLSRAQQRLQQHAAVLQTIGPVVEQARKEGAASEFIDSLVLESTSLYAEKKYGGASAAAAEYIKLAPKGDQIEQALATRSLAEAKSAYQIIATGSRVAALANEPKPIAKDRFDVPNENGELFRTTPEMNAAIRSQLAVAKGQLDQLRLVSKNDLLVVQTTHQLAEIAYAQKQFEFAADWFGLVQNAGTVSPYFVAALSGQAWSQFELKQFKLAGVGFSRLMKEFPKHELAAESAFKWGESLQLDGNVTEAAKAFGEAFETFAPSRYAYLAGLQAARVLGQQMKAEEADAAYAKLLVKFPKPENFDKLLDEWALLNYEAKRFARADEIFKRLMTEIPDSDLADNARFSLAESDLLAGKIDEAKAAFRLLEQSPKSDVDVQQDSLFRLMAIADEQQQWDELAKLADAMRSRFPNGPFKSDAAFYLALSQLQRKQIDPALELLKPLAAAKSEPQMAEKNWFPRVFILLAETLFQQKKYPEAIAVVTDFRAWDSKNRLLYQAEEILGRVYKQQTKFDEARAVFKQVIDDPNSSRTETAAKAQLMIAETYFIQKDFQSALENYLRVVVLFKFPAWQAPALFQAGACDEELGDWPKAVEDYETLLKDFPQSEWAEKAKPRLAAAKLKVK